jgi:hypothetical protein
MRLKPQTRFLLRGSVLLVALLALWWFVLLNPMLILLKGAGEAFLTIQETAAGDWTLSVPLDRVMPATSAQPVAQQIHSIDFDMQRTDLIAFTFSLPVFWALMLAAPGLRRSLPALMLGSAIMAAIELAMFLAFSQIAVRNAFAHIAGIDDATSNWARHLGEYMIEDVLPFALPFAVALSLHRELRGAIFAWSQVPSPVPNAAVNTAPIVPSGTIVQPKRGKKRVPK